MTGSRLARVPALAAIAALAMPPFGCGGEAERVRGSSKSGQSAGTAYKDVPRGYTVRVPDPWFRAVKQVSELTDPREILTLATFPLLRHRPTNCEAFAGSARSQMASNDVLLTVQERGYDRDSSWTDFPPRPQRFGPAGRQPAEPGERGCGDPPGATAHWRNFSDAGRHFHTLVVVGPDTSARARTEAWGILDSLRFDPDRRPSWPSAG